MSNLPILTILALFAQLGIVHAQIADSLTPHLRWRRPAFSQARAISLDGSKVLFLGRTEFGIWERAKHDIARAFPIGDGNVIAAAFAPGDTSLYALLTNESLTQSLSGGIAHLVIPNLLGVEVSLYQYSLRTGERILRGTFTTRVPDLHFSEDGKKLFEHFDHFIEVIDTRTGKVTDSCGVSRLPDYSYMHEAGVGDLPEYFRPNASKGVYPSPDGKYYVLYSGNDSLTVFQQTPLKELYTFSTVEKHEGFFESIWISQNNQLHFISYDSLRSWNLDTRQFRPAFANSHDDHPTWISEDSLVGVRLYREGGFRRPMLFDYGNPYWGDRPMPDDSLYLIDLKHGSTKYLGPISGLCDLMHRTSRWVIFSKQDAAYGLLDLQTLHRDTLQSNEFNACWLTNLDGERAIMAHTYSGSGLVLDARGGSAVRKYVDYGPSPAHKSPDGRYDYFEIRRDSVVVRDLTSGKIIKQFPAPGSGGAYLRFSPDSRWLAAIDYGQSELTTIRLVDLAAPSREIKLSVNNPSRWFRFSDDSKSIYAFGSYYGAVEKWNVDSARMEYSFHPDNCTTRNVLTSNDNKWLVTLNDSGTLRLWHNQDTALRSVLRTGETPKYASFTPNGRYLIVVTNHGTMLVDLMQDKLLGLISGMDSIKLIQDCLFTNNEFFSAGWGGEVCAYDIPEAWLRATPNPIRPVRVYLPIRVYIPPAARAALVGGQPFSPARTDAKVEIHNRKHALVVKLLEGTLRKGEWHLWDWDATNQPKGRYYMRATIGGVVEEEPVELH